MPCSSYEVLTYTNVDHIYVIYKTVPSASMLASIHLSKSLFEQGYLMLVPGTDKTYQVWLMIPIDP